MSATGDASKAILRLSKEKALVTSKPVPGVRFEPGSEEKPLEWVMFVDGPVRVPRSRRARLGCLLPRRTGMLRRVAGMPCGVDRRNYTRPSR